MRVSSTTLAAFLLLAAETSESFSIQRPSPITASTTNSVSAPLASVRLSNSRLSVVSTLETTNSITAGPDGVYSLTNEQDHSDFLSQHPDELVILKVYAPWCRACKGLAPKFAALARDDILKNTPISFAQLSIQHNKDFIKGLGVLALPTVQFYVAGRLIDTFACGPSKVPLLKRKLSTLIADYVDSNGQLKPSAYEHDEEDDSDDASVASTEEQNNISDADKMRITESIPYFKTMSIADRDAAMDEARVLTFPAGAVIVREGTPGDTFYVIQEGEVELVQQTTKDPLSGYLGTVINQLGQGNFFGERALITGEMNAASVRAATDVRVLAFATDSFPASSVLSGRTRDSYNLDPLNDKYGVVTNMEQTMVKQFRDLSLANQVRGSVNTPRSLEEDEVISNETLPDVNTEDIFSLLTRMQRIRHVSNCFRYIVDTGATWPSPRRQLLADRLTPGQRAEFTEIFDMMDVNHDGRIDLAELQRLMQSIGEEDISMNKAEMSFDDYMGLMAEAEFYTLFREIFQQLDHNQSGFVKAQDLEKVLCGVRDLISDDRNSVIDVEDKDMLIDYEQFTRMLLGTTLVSSSTASSLFQT